MADNKKGRDEQAHNERRRQRERDIATELERGDEPRPPVEVEDLAALEVELEALDYPVTGSDVVATVGEVEVEAADGPYTVAELVPDADAEAFDSPAAVRERIQRPTIATAMKRVVEAADGLSNVEFGRSQRDAYERTFEELEAIDADDDDEGIAVIRDWIVEQIETKEKLPGSRGVRRQAAKFCRANGYQVRNDEWLGI